MAKLEQIEVDGTGQSAPPLATAPVQHQQESQSQSQTQSCYSVDVPNDQVAGESLAVGDPWKTGLLDCNEDPRSAIMTAFLPCVTFGQITEVLDAGEMDCALGGYIYLAMMPMLCSHWLMGSKYRAKLRRNFNLVEAPYSDVITHIFCPFCALAQEFRELRIRGFDPDLGWKGIETQRRGTRNGHQESTFPPPNQGMFR